MMPRSGPRPDGYFTVRERYREAVRSLRTRKEQVTDATLAVEMGVRERTVRDYLKRYPKYRAEWRVKAAIHTATGAARHQEIQMSFKKLEKRLRGRKRKVSHREVARLLGMPVGNLHSLLSRNPEFREMIAPYILRRTGGRK